jgi:hydroxyethylthiazole kinase-like sugar kinase family protein
MVNEVGDPVSLSIKEADEIDAVFAEVCKLRVAGKEANEAQRKHILNYCRQLTIDMLESVSNKRIEQTLKPENLELAFG